MKKESNVGDLSQLPSDDKKDELKLDFSNIKVCIACETAKPFHFFYMKHKGLDSTCKSCRYVQRKKRYKNSGATEVDATNLNNEPACKNQKKATSSKPSLLTAVDIQKIAEAMLILEGWQMDLDTQRDLSNSNSISQTKQK